MRAELLLVTINDETISPDDVKVLCINAEGKLLTTVTSKSLYTKWSTDVKQASLKNKGYYALVDFTFEGEVSHSHIVNITEEEARVLDNIVNVAFNNPKALTEDSKIPEEMRWAPSQIIDGVIKYVEANKDNLLNREHNIAGIIGKDDLRDMERKGLFIEDKKEGNLALCMWKMGAQIKGRNTYVTLVFTEQCTFQINMVEIESQIQNVKDAVCKLFNISSPIELHIERPKTSLKDLFGELNPANLINPKHIPWRAIIPNDKDNKICLCLEESGEFFNVGIILEDAKPAIAKLKNHTKELTGVINSMSTVCRSYLSGSVPKESISFLADLLTVVKMENLGITLGEELHIL